MDTKLARHLFAPTTWLRTLTAPSQISGIAAGIEVRPAFTPSAPVSAAPPQPSAAPPPASTYSASAPAPAPPPEPVPTEHTGRFSIWINPFYLQFVAVALLFLVFVLSFFTWVGFYPGGVWVDSQNGWQATFNSVSTDMDLKDVSLVQRAAEPNLRAFVGTAACGADSRDRELHRSANLTPGSMESDILALFAFPEHVRDLGASRRLAQIFAGFAVQRIAGILDGRAIGLNRRSGAQRTQQDCIGAVTIPRAKDQIASSRARESLGQGQ